MVVVDGTLMGLAQLGEASGRDVGVFLEDADDGVPVAGDCGQDGCCPLLRCGDLGADFAGLSVARRQAPRQRFARPPRGDVPSASDRWRPSQPPPPSADG